MGANSKGYFKANSIIDDRKISSLKKICEAYYAETKNAVMPVADFLATPELAQIPFLPSVVAELRKQLGDDYVTIPEYTMQTDQFGGWHTDSANLGLVDFVYDPSWSQVQLAVYLQDNDAEYGGGLDVRPRGHEEYLTALRHDGFFRRVLRRLRNKLIPSYSIPSKAGDLVGFHFRLLHRASQQLNSRRKFAIFWVAAKNTPEVQRYIAHLKSYQGGLGDFEYSQDTLGLIAEQRLNVANLSGGFVNDN